MGEEGRGDENDLSPSSVDLRGQLRAVECAAKGSHRRSGSKGMTSR